MAKTTFTHDILFSIIGYSLILTSIMLLSGIVYLITGYFPSIQFFILSLFTFRLNEISPLFLVAPFLTTIFTIRILNYILHIKRLAYVFGLASYYILVVLSFGVMRSPEFPYEISILWIVWVSILATISAIILEKVIN